MQTCIQLERIPNGVMLPQAVRRGVNAHLTMQWVSGCGIPTGTSTNGVYATTPCTLIYASTVLAYNWMRGDAGRAQVLTAGQYKCPLLAL